MSLAVTAQDYGKQNVRVIKVTKNGQKHSMTEFNVRCTLDADFTAAYRDGDNSSVVPTDTMKNTIYALAKDHAMDSPESFGLFLCDHFLKNYSHLTHAQMVIEVNAWERMVADGKPADYSFTGGYEATRWTQVSQSRGAKPQVTSGIRDWWVMKTSGSAFAGYSTCKYTTLKPTMDRAVKTKVYYGYRFASIDGVDFNATYEAVQASFRSVFVALWSKSVQHIIWVAGEAVLKAHSNIVDIKYSLPNIHNIKVDLSPFGRTNDNEVYWAMPEPSGVISATIGRDSAKARL